MADACVTDLHAGVIRGAITAVDCRTRGFAELGYHGLAGSPVFQNALTIALVIYVALLGWRLLFAWEGVRLSDAPGMAISVGSVLALAASWTLFQTVVFDVASKASLEVAAMVSAPIQAAAGQPSRSPLDRLETAYDQLNDAAQAFGRVAPAVAKAYTSGAAAGGEALSGAASALFATTAGIICVSIIAVGVLTAVGPLFVTLLLFRPTRGLFEGWVRALVAAALAPMGAWILIVMMLAVIEPWLAALTHQISEGVIDSQAALTTAAIVLVFCAAQVALAVGSGVIATGFRWPGRRRQITEPLNLTRKPEVAAVQAISRAQQLAVSVQHSDRRLSLAETRPLAVSPRGAPALRSDARPSGSDRALSLRRPSVRRPRSTRSLP